MYTLFLLFKKNALQTKNINYGLQKLHKSIYLDVHSAKKTLIFQQGEVVP